MWGVKNGSPGLAELTLSVGRIVNDFSSGMRDSATKGRGPEFVGYREYDPADTARDIAWRASARLPDEDAILSQDFAPERQVRLLIVADERRSMHLPEAKPVYAESLVRLFALAALENDDEFGIVGIGGKGIIYSGWLASEDDLNEFLRAANDEKWRATFRAGASSLGALLDDIKAKNMIVIFLSDLSKPEDVPIEALRGIDIHALNMRCIAVVLDEWNGFVPSNHLLAVQHPETKRTVVMDMRPGGEVSKEVDRFNVRVKDLKQRGKRFEMNVLTVPLLSQEPFREFYRQWLKCFDE